MNKWTIGAVSGSSAAGDLVRRLRAESGRADHRRGGATWRYGVYDQLRILSCGGDAGGGESGPT